jgi:hypothetical protein
LLTETPTAKLESPQSKETAIECLIRRPPRQNATSSISLIYVISRCIIKSMYLEKPKQPIIWDRGSNKQRPTSPAIKQNNQNSKFVLVAILQEAA